MRWLLYQLGWIHSPSRCLMGTCKACRREAKAYEGDFKGQVMVSWEKAKPSDGGLPVEDIDD